MPAAVTLEPARTEDAPRIAALSRRLIEQGLAPRWNARLIAGRIRDPDVEVVVARAGRELVGFAIMSFAFARRRAHLLLFAVEPCHRRRGVGRALLDWLLVMARRGGVEGVQLEVRATNRGARAFYRAHGFEEVALLAGYYEQREDALVLTKQLAARTDRGR